MDVADADVPARRFQSLAQQSSISQTVLHDGSVTIEPKVNQVVVLADNVSPRSREVQCVRLLGAAQVVEFEDQVFWQQRLVAPDDPAYTGVDKTELVARSIDGLHALVFKVPAKSISLFPSHESVEALPGRTASLGMCERGDETTTSGIDVDWNIHSRPGLILVEYL